MTSTTAGARTSLQCACGYRPRSDEARPFQCGQPHSGDFDHVLRRSIDVRDGDDLRASFLSREADPFIRFRQLLHSWNVASALGLPDSDFIATVLRLQERIEKIDGGRFEVTPLETQRELRDVVTDGGELWVKDETGNVSGSHKGRHFMGLMLWMELMARYDRSLAEAPLAVASCGNAALAAAVVARAAGRTLEVFIPTDANPMIVEKLQALGARVTRCERVDGVAGDPAYLAFRQAVARGALPFTCQGNENGLVIEGGATLGWEIVSQLLETRSSIDRVVIQVGGGALASACVSAFEDAVALGLIPRLPRLHAVQTDSAFPLARAFARVSALAEAVGMEAALQYAAQRRSEFMWPWETAAHSIAGGILDDETYDWLPIVRAMLLSGGSAVVVTEERLADANVIGRRTTAIDVDPTGSAGLAGLMELEVRGELQRGESAVVIFTGVRRGPTRAGEFLAP